MRVAFHAPMKPPDHAVPSGDRRVANLVIAALECAGHEVALASRFRAYDGIGDAAAQRALAAQGHDEARRLIDSWRGGGAPDAWVTYHLYHKAPDWLGPAVACALGIPYVVVEPSHAPKQRGGRWDVGHAGAAKAIGKADALLCLTCLDLAHVAPLAKPGAVVEFLPPFLDAAPYAAAAAARARARADLARRFGLDPDVVWLLAVGMMRRRDKLDSYRLLGRALAGLPREGWRLIVVGDGEERTAVELALGPRTVFAGEQPPDALPGFYAAADLYAWPAIGEAYGMALLEAQAAGLPVVAGHTRGVPDVVADGETGVLVPLGDAPAFAQALARLIVDPARRRALGAAATAHASSRDLPAVAARLDRLLTALKR
jgi:glycosyltransferase involved in cell wall biosynthesis